MLNNFAIMKYNGKDLLCLVQAGYFASTAWLESQEAFNQVTGESFGIITGDDNQEYKESKYKFRLPESKKEVIELLKTCCKSFQIEAVNYITESKMERIYILDEVADKNVKLQTAEDEDI